MNHAKTVALTLLIATTTLTNKFTNTFANTLTYTNSKFHQRSRLNFFNMEEPPRFSQFVTITSLPHKPSPSSHIQQSDDDIIQVTDYYQTRNHSSNSLGTYQTQSYYSDDSSVQETEHHFSDSLSADDSRFPFESAEIETLDSDSDESDDTLTILDYANVDENGMDELMRFGLYEPSESLVNKNGNNHIDVNEVTESTNLDLPQLDDASKALNAITKMDYNVQNNQEMDVDSAEEQELERFNSSSSDCSLVILYEKSRFKTKYEFGEIETLDEEESERDMKLYDSDDTESQPQSLRKEVELDVDSREKGAEKVHGEPFSGGSGNAEVTEDSLKLEVNDRESNKQRFAELDVGDVEEEYEIRTETKGKREDQVMEETKEHENEKSVEVNTGEVEESDEENTTIRNEEEQNQCFSKDSESKGSSCSTCGSPTKIQTHPVKKRNVLKRVARLFSKCFGKTANQCHECHADR